MATLYARTVSAALRKLGFNPASKRGTREGVKVSGEGRVRVAADFDDLEFAWRMIADVAEALEGAGWVVERAERPRNPGLYVTGKAEVKETGMTVREVPAVGDVVTVSGEHVSDGVTRVGIVEAVGAYSQRLGGHLLTLRSVRVDTTWTDTWNPDTMILTRVDMACDHEVTGGYVYTGDPAGSRSMELECVALHDIDGERTWFRGWDEERMEVEVTVKGLTGVVVRREVGGGILGSMLDAYLSLARDRRSGAELMILTVIGSVLGLTGAAADEWLAEELQEIMAARG